MRPVFTAAVSFESIAEFIPGQRLGEYPSELPPIAGQNFQRLPDQFAMTEARKLKCSRVYFFDLAILPDHQDRIVDRIENAVADAGDRRNTET